MEPAHATRFLSESTRSYHGTFAAWVCAMKPLPLRRRVVLVTVACSMFAAFTSPSAAQDRNSIELEAAPYGGTTSGRLPSRGACAFAPSVGTTFGGIGAKVRYRQHPHDNRTRGFSVTAQGAIEQQSNTVLAAGSDMQRSVPDDQRMGAGGVNVGYDWRLVGFHAGLIAREVIGAPSIRCAGRNDFTECLAEATYPDTRVAPFPDARVRLGPSEGFHGEVGVGAYTPAMLLRPGAHIGFGYATREGHDVTVRCGAQFNVGFHGGGRCDLSGAMPVSENVTLGLGGAVAPGDDRVNFDARASVTVRFGD
jgi:hypothetical protein